MRKSFKFLIALLLCAGVAAGCAKDAEQSAPSSNPQFQVDLLFAQHGVRVYRFWDNGHPVYYSDARGSVAWEQSEGKTSFPMSVPTTK